MKTVQIVKAGTDEVIASFTEYPDPEGIRGIMAEGYRAIVDGQELKIESGGEADDGDD
ncbi:hypothetical protein [Galactobacillus timonensis]|uniref:hypothetical protein n=1 Tax=Galactobacillus timonensis TaxID=2041840 RepID=UPI0024090B1F|nr:hypothetical protein [Galactobacillus timonensis]MDD6369154.1 hypothetical protein [Galactobacillus timonensis]